VCVLCVCCPKFWRELFGSWVLAWLDGWVGFLWISFSSLGGGESEDRARSNGAELVHNLIQFRKKSKKQSPSSLVVE
jgi:hypothetical protein